MNFKFKFNLGDEVVVPYLTFKSKATGQKASVIGEVESLRVYRDKSILVLVRWGAGSTVYADWFTEKELKMAKKEKAASAHPKKKPAPKKKTVKKKTTRRQTRGMGGYPALG